jgi:hypothetical protein
LIESFVSKVQETLQLQGYGPNQLTVESFNRMLHEFKNELTTHVMRVMNIPDSGLQHNVNDDVVVADVPIN